VAQRSRLGASGLCFRQPISPLYPSWDYVATLAEGLTPVELDADGLKAVRESYHNSNREEHLARRGPGVYYAVDCDILSFLYLTIADALKLPLRILERPSLYEGDPGHNFVRWELADGKFVDWETITAERREPTSGAYVMSDAQLSGYLQALLGGLWLRAWSTPRAITAYRKALADGYETPAVLNQLAWYLSTDPDPSVRDPAAAMLYANRLCSGKPTAGQIDTCAAAAARQGDFELAVDLQTKALDKVSGEATKARMRERLALYRTRRPYTQARVREQQAIEACDDIGDLFGRPAEKECPDPSKSHRVLEREIRPDA